MPAARGRVVYAPTKNPELAKQRQAQVLKKMIDNGYLTESEAKDIIDGELEFAK